MKFSIYLFLLVFSSTAFASSASSSSDTLQLITTIVLIITLIIAILTYLSGHRPYVGIIKSDANYDQIKNELSFKITIKNTGNVTACAMKTSSRCYENKNMISERMGDASFILFPNQVTHGAVTFNGITNAHLQNNSYYVNYFISYEQPIIFGIGRHLETIQRMKYDPAYGNFQVESGSFK